MFAIYLPCVLKRIIPFKNLPYSLNVEFHNVGGCGTHNYHWNLNGEIIKWLTELVAKSLGRNTVHMLQYLVTDCTRLHILQADVYVARNNTDRDVFDLSRGTVLRS